MNSNMAFVRIILLSLLFIAGLAACSKPHELKPASSNSELQQRLVGTWKASKNLANGNTDESTMVVAANGTYVCDFSDFNRTHYRAIHVEGQWEIKDGFLIDTMTLNTSATNIRMPVITRDKIIRLDTDELVLGEENFKSNSVASVFHREKSK